MSDETYVDPRQPLPEELWRVYEHDAEHLDRRPLGRPPSTPFRFADLAVIIAGGITAPEADRLSRDDGVHLCYSARANGFQGEPESGKTWAALLAIARTLTIAGVAVFLDLEDTAAVAVSRLRALGLTDRQIVAGLRYVGREELHAASSVPEVVAAIIDASPDDVLVDSVGEFMVLCDLDENKAEDVLRFRDRVIAPLTGSGSTVYLIDHVTKDKETRGRWARGNGAKLGMMDGAVYSVRSDGFNQTTAGRIVLTLQKDRHGSLPGTRGDDLASIYVEPRSDGTLHITVDPPLPKRTEEERRAGRDELDRLEVDRIKSRLLHVLDVDGALKASEAETRTKAARKADGIDAMRFGHGKFEQAVEELRNEGHLVKRPGDTARGEHPNAQMLALPATQQALPDTT